MKEPHGAERIDAQLKLLQQRNLEWAQETARLLEEEVARAEVPLLARVEELQAVVLKLERDRDQLASRLTDAVSASIQEALGQRGSAGIRQSAGPIRHPPVSLPVKQLSASLRTRTVPLRHPVEAVKPLRHAHRHHLAKPAASIAVLMLVGYLAASQLPSRLTGLAHNQAPGQVAGISTQKDGQPKATSLQDKYPESYATVAFANTVWTQYADSDFGIQIQYPRNATDIAHVVGGSNLWFLRGDGYLLKITKLDGTAGQSLSDWWTLNGSQYVSDTPPALSAFAGMPAWSLPSGEKTATSGSEYFVKPSAQVYQVWVKDEPPTTDDGQRLQAMVKSLHIT